MKWLGFHTCKEVKKEKRERQKGEEDSRETAMDTQRVLQGVETV